MKADTQGQEFVYGNERERTITLPAARHDRLQREARFWRDECEMREAALKRCEAESDTLRAAADALAAAVEWWRSAASVDAPYSVVDRLAAHAAHTADAYRSLCRMQVRDAESHSEPHKSGPTADSGRSPEKISREINSLEGAGDAA